MNNKKSLITVSTEDFDFSASGHNLANNFRHEHEVLADVIIR
jgi:hypothetical protein